jgi:hypothetical protein
MHPIALNLNELSVSQIEQKITKLNSFYFMTADEHVRQQIILLLDSYKIELEERRLAAKKIQDEKNNGNDLDSLIKVN